VVDFHGAYKPDGLRITYPNLITSEGVMGNEYNKWSGRVTPEHNCTLPYTRMLAGPMDYTPGGFINRTPELFTTGTPAKVMTTRCQQLAMFVVYDSPFVVACDHPGNYYGQKGIDFLKTVPTTWDDTRVLAGEVGEYIVMARRKGEEWYLGAMNDRHPKKIPVKTDFLGIGEYMMEFYKDGPGANEDATDIVKGEMTVMANGLFEISMASGGGFAARLSKNK
jgi:alpha-glucosidase